MGVFVTVCLPVGQCLSGKLAPGILLVRVPEQKNDVHRPYLWHPA